jgi:hypothetical protein
MSRRKPGRIPSTVPPASRAPRAASPISPGPPPPKMNRAPSPAIPAPIAVAAVRKTGESPNEAPQKTQMAGVFVIGFMSLSDAGLHR